jgi:CRP-like cAMP-binding protein
MAKMYPRFSQIGKSSLAAAPLGIAYEHSKPSAPKQRDIFAELSQTERQSFLERCKELHFEAGSRLFSQNERYTTTYLIRSGIVRTYYVSPTGKEITIAYWSDGALVGGPNVFNEQSTHIWSAQATTDAVTLSIRGRDLEEISMKVPALAHYLIDTLTFKLHWVSVLLQTFGTESVRLRLAHLLLQLSEHYGIEHKGGTMIKHHFSHEELARMVGATRTWVSITLGSFKKEGILTCNGRHLVILSKRNLEKVILAAR